MITLCPHCGEWLPAGTDIVEHLSWCGASFPAASFGTELPFEALEAMANAAAAVKSAERFEATARAGSAALREAREAERLEELAAARGFLA
jgi:hypothetical protein